jgi:hypothetical protein
MITITETLFNKMPADLQAMFKRLPNPGSDEVVGLFPETASGKGVAGMGDGKSKGLFGNGSLTSYLYGDTGSAARFFKQIDEYKK